MSPPTEGAQEIQLVPRFQMTKGIISDTKIIFAGSRRETASVNVNLRQRGNCRRSGIGGRKRRHCEGASFYELLTGRRMSARGCGRSGRHALRKHGGMLDGIGLLQQRLLREQNDRTSQNRRQTDRYEHRSWAVLRTSRQRLQRSTSASSRSSPKSKRPTPSEKRDERKSSQRPCSDEAARRPNFKLAASRSLVKTTIGSSRCKRQVRQTVHPGLRTFELAGQLQQQRLAAEWTDELNAKRQAVGRPMQRHTHRRRSRQVDQLRERYEGQACCDSSTRAPS